MGMLIFEDEDVDIVVLETGLGGRLDATNSILNPLACVITSISLDHVEYLGDTIDKIAGEKAGIIKKGVPVIFDANNETAAAVIRSRAEELGCPAHEVRAEARSFYPTRQKESVLLLIPLFTGRQSCLFRLLQNTR